MTKLVAITGNIGSGKSYVSSLFAKLGVPVFYSDTEAKKMYYKEDIRQALVARFGDGLYNTDGTIDKAFVASLIFGDSNAAAFIEGLLYPALNDYFMEWAKAQGSAYVLYESAIIFEKGMDDRFNAIIMVTASEETRLRRVMLRDACDEASVRARMSKQWGDSYKISRSDYVIKHEYDNEDDYLYEQVTRVNGLITGQNTNLKE